MKAVIAGHFHRNARVEHPDGGPPTIVASAFATFWGRQASYRVFSYEDGQLSYQDAYIEDPPEGARISYDGFIVEEKPAEEAPAPAADPPRCSSKTKEPDAKTRESPAGWPASEAGGRRRGARGGPPPRS